MPLHTEQVTVNLLQCEVMRPPMLILVIKQSEAIKRKLSQWDCVTDFLGELEGVRVHKFLRDDFCRVLLQRGLPHPSLLYYGRRPNGKDRVVGASLQGGN